MYTAADINISPTDNSCIFILYIIFIISPIPVIVKYIATVQPVYNIHPFISVYITTILLIHIAIHKNAPQKRGAILVIKLSSRIVHNVKPCKEKILLLLACNTLCER